MLLAFSTIMLSACKKDKDNAIPSNLPRTDVPTQLQGSWMYGYFSMTEYWAQNPATYLGNGFEVAIAFKFFPNGTFEQYFTSSTVTAGVKTYHQSFSKGTVEVNVAASTFTTHCASSHYKRTQNGITVEDRDLAGSELNGATKYQFANTTDNGTKAVLLTLEGTSNPLKFLQKF